MRRPGGNEFKITDMKKTYLNTYLVIRDGDNSIIVKQFEDHFLITDEVYFVRSELSTSSVTTRLSVGMDINDRIIVVKLSDEATWNEMDDGFSTWIVNALQDHWDQCKDEDQSIDEIKPFLITYNTDEESTRYRKLSGHLSNSYSHKHLFRGVWMIKSNLSSGLIAMRIKRFMNINDKFAVAQVSSDMVVKLEEYF